MVDVDDAMMAAVPVTLSEPLVERFPAAPMVSAPEVRLTFPPTVPAPSQDPPTAARLPVMVPPGERLMLPLASDALPVMVPAPVSVPPPIETPLVEVRFPLSASEPELSVTAPPTVPLPV